MPASQQSCWLKALWNGTTTSYQALSPKHSFRGKRRRFRLRSQASRCIVVIMYNEWTRRALLSVLAAAGYAKPAVRVGCQTRSYGQPPPHLAELPPLPADLPTPPREGDPRADLRAVAALAPQVRRGAVVVLVAVG